MLLNDLEDKINFPEIEKNILKFWENEKIFELIQAERREDYEKNIIDIYSFYDGPPFATGLPHYGHILAGTIKDVMARYATQRNLYVERRFGWDCHGLPVEYEIDKKFGIRSTEDVAAMGIATYNNECRQIVMRYAKEWEAVVKRMGRWIDFRNDYKTMYPWFMESVWWVFAQLYAKGMIYRGVKIMPYSVGCRTPISNFEAGQNFKEIVDVSLNMTLDIVAPGNEFDGNKLLVWTTTPWSLHANMAVCVNANIEYVQVRNETNGVFYILAKNCFKLVFTDSKLIDDLVITKVFFGLKLKNLHYKPPFDEFRFYGQHNAFRVLLDDYVFDTAGTGIVHLAPYFGEDDFRICRVNGIIDNDIQFPCPIDENGKFTKVVEKLEGIYFRDANDPIIALLREDGRVFSVGQVRHSYPFCWRSDTPLIYMAVPSWFVRVEPMIANLKRNVSQSNWVPDIIKEKRFANWLSNAHDWAISRNRYWGTPIPIWASETGDEIVCIGSIEELQQRTGMAHIKDLHRESIDHLVIPSAYPGRQPLHRIHEVFDCWFESGAMPYAQAHYPFENVATFEKSFPADFVAEGIDQTRGWFYTLLVLSTALFDKPPFRNLIVNGLMLATDGQKMSKSKNNYPDPIHVVDKYGADALRFYLLNSPLVRAGNVSFKENGLKDITKSILLPWFNAFKFLIQNIERFELDEEILFTYDHQTIMEETNFDIFDKWFLSYNESHLKYITAEMNAYRLYRVMPKLVDFIDHMTNWYIRFRRTRLKGDEGTVVCRRTLNVLFHGILNSCKNMAAFMPFFSEFIYQNLLKYIKDEVNIKSIHNCKLSAPCEELIDNDIEKLMIKFQRVIFLVRKLRERHGVPIKYPIKDVVVIHTNMSYLTDLQNMKFELLKELNCHNLNLTTERQQYGVKLRAQPNYKLLGLRFKNELKEIQREIKNLDDTRLTEALLCNDIEIFGHKLKMFEDIFVVYKYERKHNTKSDDAEFFDFENDEQFVVGVNFETTPDMYDEGTAREIISCVQKIKKAAKLRTADKVIVYYSLLNNEENILHIILNYEKFIANAIKSEFQQITLVDVQLENKIVENIVSIKGVSLRLFICKLT